MESVKRFFARLKPGHKLVYKIVGAFMCVMLLGSIAAAFSILKLSRIHEISGIIPPTVQGIGLGMELRNQLDRQSLTGQAFLLHNDEKYAGQFEESAQKVAEVAGQIKSASSDQKNKELMDAIIMHQERYAGIMRSEAFPEKRKGNMDRALALYSSAQGDYEVMYKALEAYTDSSNNGLADISGMVGIASKTTRTVVLIVITACFAVALVLALLISRNLSGPIVEVCREMDRMWAQNDLTERSLKVRSGDEVGVLRSTFNKMLSDRRKGIISVKSASEMLTGQSGELSAIAQHFSAASQDIAGTISGLAATVEEQAASSAQVRESAKEVSEMAKVGRVEIDRVLDSMGNISGMVAHSAGIVKSLEDQSHKIEQIITTVSGIADQTNLLALNATIEAARAGDAGRGFSVVAEEVRKLAQQSMDAAKSITGIISTIKNETGTAVKSMGEVSEEVKRGVEVSGVASQSFGNIVKNLEDVASVFADIDRGIASASSAARGLAASAEEMAASIEEVSGSAEKVTMLAEALKKGTSVYKL